MRYIRWQIGKYSKEKAVSLYTMIWLFFLFTIYIRNNDYASPILLWASLLEAEAAIAPTISSKKV